nr:retrovirus-related Pol polyprotein from transposon TNT 1-94 [Tanacetum cinerariifolium]
IVDKCKTGLGYNDVPPPYTRNFMPPKPDFSFSGLEEFVNEPIVSEHTVKKPMVETSEAKASADKPKILKKLMDDMLPLEVTLNDGNSQAEARTFKVKTMNKLVKENLVRGLPFKLFENNQDCVACQKGKQHRAFFVIDDYSRFTWVFFLASKDETSAILKTFITGIENLVDHKVKVIRCDNETKFKSREMNQFCEMKGPVMGKQKHLEIFLDLPKYMYNPRLIKEGDPPKEEIQCDLQFGLVQDAYFLLKHTQEEGIDYDEVFAPIARIEAIRLFLAYASFKDFVVYQMNVKSAFLYGRIEEKVYVYQPSGFEDPDFLDKCKKQTMVANSTTEAEYVAASSCCGQRSCLHQIPQLLIRPFHLRMYRSGVSASLAWSGQIHQRPPQVPQDEDEHEPMFIQPHDPDYVPEPMYPEYIPLEDEHVLSAEEQPLPPVVSPTAESPEYVAESDPEEDPEEYEDDETEDGPVDYPINEGDDGDDDNGESSGDDAVEEDEEEEHFVPADSAIVIPTDELISPLKGTKHVIPSPSTNTTTTGARITTLKLTSTQALSGAVTVVLPSPPLPPPLYIPPHVDRRDDILEIEMPPRKRLCLSTLGSRYEIRESSTARPTEDRGIDDGFVSTLDAEARRRGIGEVGYGIRDTWVDLAETVPEIAPMTVGEVNIRVTELAELHEHDTQDLYALLEDAQDSRTRISQRVAMDSQRVDLLIEDMIAHQETILIVEEKAYAAREAWAHSIGLRQAVHYELQTQWEQVYAYEFQLQAHQTQLQLQALREQPRRARQPGGDARVPDHQDALRDADSHI